MSRFLSKRLAELTAYVPGEQPQDTQYIKLNTNESPYPPPKGVIDVITQNEIEKLNLYPNPDGSALIDKIADCYGVSPDNIIIGNGSDEILAFAFLAFCDSDRPVCFPDITYGFYPVFAKLFGVPFETIALDDDFRIKPADYFKNDKNIIIANPNAPTGIALTLSDIESIVKSNPDYIVLIDEAYVDFGAQSAVPLTVKYDNLLVVHTFSKSRSLAGARLGYGVGSKPIIDDLCRIKYSFNPYNVNRLTQLAGAAALDSEDYFAEKRREIISAREYTQTELKRLGFITTDSVANFVFAGHHDFSAEKLYFELKQRGILVRHFNAPRVCDKLRVTIGTQRQMEIFIGTIRDIISEGCEGCEKVN